MARENYARCLANTLVYEGGWSNHPQDPGGPTMRGVIQVRYDEFRRKWKKPLRSVRLIEEDELQAIYRDGYATPVSFDQWSKGPDQLVFDIGVNSGVGRPGPLIRDVLQIDTTNLAVQAERVRRMNHQQRIAFCKALCARRERFYRGIRTFGTFGKGWLRRNAGMEAIAVKMCLEQAAVTEIGPSLEDEAARARKAQKGATGAASASAGGAAATGGAASFDPAAWDWWQWAGAGVLTLVFLAVLAAAVSAFLRHRERARAYEEAAAGAGEATLAGILADARSLPDETEEWTQ